MYEALMDYVSVLAFFDELQKILGQKPGERPRTVGTFVEREPHKMIPRPRRVRIPREAGHMPPTAEAGRVWRLAR